MDENFCQEKYRNCLTKKYYAAILWKCASLVSWRMSYPCKLTIVSSDLSDLGIEILWVRQRYITHDLRLMAWVFYP